MAMYKSVLLWGMMMSVASNSFAGQPAPAPLSEDAQRTACGNNRFALQLYQRLQGRTGNLFFSPYSISTALAMTYAGARGRTQEQMAQTLCFPTAGNAAGSAGQVGGAAALAPRNRPGSAPAGDKAPGTTGRQGQDALVTTGTPQDEPPLTPEAFAKAFGEIVRDLNARGRRGEYELRVANALWGQRDFEFLSSFAGLVESEYGGHLERVDFVAAVEKARRTVNAWVEKQTSGKIKDLIAPGAFDSMTRLVLTNAVYFKGKWATQFQKNRTADEPFTLPDGGRVQVPMMNQQATFGYAETDTLQVLEMPYVGPDLSMVILLPKETAGLGALEKDLTEENVSSWLGTIRRQEVIVAVPRFKMTHRLDLATVLRTMGMTDAFSQTADFSGMTGRRDLFVSAVVHQAYVDVNEEGTEAAAATAVTMRLVSMAPGRVPVFRADHPFVFLIRDARTGSILFLGRTVNPKE